MDDDAFDRALIAAAFEAVAQQGWSRFSVAGAARQAGLPLDRARLRFPTRHAVLLRFGRLADQAALAGAATEGAARDRLFDTVMRRIDVLQTHRAGISALLRALPFDPPTALLLALATRRSMGWLLEAAGIPGRLLQQKALLAVWLYTVRAWDRDESGDLSATMAALDRALDRVGRIAGWTDTEPGLPPGAPDIEPLPD
ncbi:MAG: TetR family transcriptional regulator [Acidisphaera sp.]|nr:TetR family transcriptional regulator [Acidisphaera sp.]